MKDTQNTSTALRVTIVAIALTQLLTFWQMHKTNEAQHDINVSQAKFNESVIRVEKAFIKTNSGKGE